MDTSKEAQRWNFVDAVRSGQWSVSELCARFGISRTTGYKWLGRSDGSFAAFRDRSRAPAWCPHRTPEALERDVLALRARYGWGAKKLRQILARRHHTHDAPLSTHQAGHGRLAVGAHPAIDQRRLEEEAHQPGTTAAHIGPQARAHQAKIPCEDAGDAAPAE